jgi:SHS2 domain-containing protein
LVKGVSVSAERLAEASELKAVTYHQLAFGRDEAAGNELWRARVIFDV